MEIYQWTRGSTSPSRFSGRVKVETPFRRLRRGEGCLRGLTLPWFDRLNGGQTPTLPLTREGKLAIAARLNTNDEAYVVLAFIYAMMRQESVAIITADRHVFDIFQKVQWFIDTHYRSWLVGQALVRGIYGTGHNLESTRSKEFFAGPVELFARKSTHFHEVLERRAKYLDVDAYHVEHDGTINWHRFTFDSEIFKAMAVKAESNGLNSCTYSPRNVHIDLTPLGSPFDEMIGVALDLTAGAPMNSRIPVSRLDFLHAMHSRERAIVIPER